MRTDLPSREPSGLRGRVAALCACTSVVAILLALCPAQAADFIWAGSGSTTTTTDYNLGTNWSKPPAGAPTAAGRSAIFDSAGSSTVVVTSGAITVDGWVFNATAQSYSISGGNVRFDVSAPALVNQANAGQTISISNSLRETGASAQVSQEGDSTLILSAKNTYSGGTAISAGTLVGSHAAAGTIDALGTGAVTMTGGTLRFDVNGTFNNTITVSSPSAPDPAIVVLSAGSHNVELANTVTLNAAAIARFGNSGDTGTITLSGANFADASSAVVVAAGTLKDGGNAAITALTFSAASTTVNAGATLNFNNSFNQAIRNLNGGGNVRMGNAVGNNLTLFVDPGTTQTFAGSISGTHGSVLIEITGGPPGPTGTMVFTGANTYAGGTTICSCAALQLGDGGNTASIVGDVTNYGKFNIVNAVTAGITSITNDREFPGATPGKTTFSNGSSASSIAITNLHAGKTVFNDTSTAANATIVNRLNGTTVFNDNSTAGNASITNRNTGLTAFNNTATAGGASINNNGGETDFNNHSSAGAAVIVNRNGGLTSFANNSTAGSAQITNRFGSETAFGNNSTAGSATIIDRFGSLTLFANNSDAGNAGITNQFAGALVFANKSSAASATIVNNSFGGPALPFAGVLFTNQSTAGNATILNNNNGLIAFGVPFSFDKTTAGNANITNNAGSFLQFNGLTTADSATITTNSGAQTVFFDGSTGGNARFITNGTGFVDFGQSIGPNFDGRITAGSIEGSGLYYIGAGNTLVAGSNNLSTEVSGVIADNNPCAAPRAPARWRRSALANSRCRASTPTPAPPP